MHAMRKLGRTHVPAHIVPIDNIVRGEFAENVERDDFTPSEMVDIGRAVEPLLREQAKERKREGGRNGGKASGKLPEASNGDARDHVARYCGISGRTYEKAKAVVDAAEREPERFGKLIEEMDRTRRVNGVHKKLTVAEKAEAIRKETPPLPGRGPYRVIVADPPWAYNNRAADPSHRGACPYPQMGIEEICALAAADIAHDDALLWLWTTNAHMRDAFAVIDAWGFEHKTILTWVKDRMGTGDWLRGRSEHCLLAVRGKPTVQLSNQTTALHAPAGEHSAKPDEFYTLVETLCPAPRYAELFQRKSRPNWDGHGDEA